MENKNPVPVELNDEELGNVIGGVMSGTMLRNSCANVVDPNDEDCVSGLIGMDLQASAIKKA